jgi:ferredoxin--NADP+ reductase
VRVDGGALTPRLWDLQTGDAVRISQRAAGSFTLSHAPRHPELWLIATGTGLAPYVAMLRTPIPWQTFERIILVHGVRHCRDLSYVEEFRQYSQKYGDQFHYVPMATREECPQGLSGRITTRLEDGGLERHVGATFSGDRSTVMLCGNPDMLNDMESILCARGLAKHRKKNPGHIVVERYWERRYVVDFWSSDLASTSIARCKTGSTVNVAFSALDDLAPDFSAGPEVFEDSCASGSRPNNSND